MSETLACPTCGEDGGIVLCHKCGHHWELPVVQVPTRPRLTFADLLATMAGEQFDAAVQRGLCVRALVEQTLGRRLEQGLDDREASAVGATVAMEFADELHALDVVLGPRECVALGVLVSAFAEARWPMGVEDV